MKTHLKKHLLLLLFVALNINLFSQNPELDSLEKLITQSNISDTARVKTMCQLARLIVSNDQERAIQISMQALDISKNTNYINGIARANYLMCLAYYYKGQFNKSIEFANESLKYAREINNIDQQYEAYNLLAISNGRLGNFKKKLEYLFICKNIAPDDEKLIVCLVNLGNTYVNLNDLTKSLDFFIEALPLAKNYPSRLAIVQLNISDNYRKLGNYEKALEYGEKALKIRKELNDLRGIHYAAREIGVILYDMGNYKEAYTHFKEADYYANKISFEEGIAYSLMYMAKINLHNNNLTDALNNIKQSLVEIEKTDFILTKKEILETLVAVYKAKKDYQNALSYFEYAKTLNDSIFNTEKSKQIAELQTIYETEKKQQEIETQRIQIDKQNTQTKFLFLFLFMIFGFAIAVYSRFKLKKRTNKILDHKNELLEEKNKELQKLSIVASQTSNAVTIFNSKGKVEWFNKAAEELYGSTLEEFIKSKGDYILDASNSDKIKEHFDFCINTLQSCIYETIIISGKQKKHIQTTLTPIQNENNEIERFVAIDTDITDLKIAEEEILTQNEEIKSQKDELEVHRNHLEKLVNERTRDLKIAKEKAEESDRLKSSFLANMSHEIRTPMNAIIGFSELLNDPDLKFETKQELIQLINHNSNTLLRLIDDIIDIAKIESGQLSININQCNISELLRNLEITYENKKKLYHKDHIQIRAEIPNSYKSLIIYSDQFRLEQVISNLIENALKFTDEGTIEFGFKVNKNMLNFFVKDTGIGISIEQQEVIFQRFSKIEDNKKKLYRGAGLGLAISKNLISLMNGEISVKSELNKGSIFEFTLPYNR